MNKSKFMTSNLGVLLMACICCSLWGSAMPSIKLGYQFFNIDPGDTWTIMLFAGVRFTLAGLIVIIAISLQAGKLLKPAKSSARLVFNLSMFQTILQYFFFYLGLAHTTGIKTSIIGASNTFICVLLACFIFRLEKMHMNKFIGCLVGFAGVVLINLSGGAENGGLEMSFTLLGEGAVLLSTTSGAVSSVLIKKYSNLENPVILSGYQFALGGLILTIVALIGGGRFPQITTAGIAMIFYLACVSAIAYSLWSLLLKYNPVSKVTVFGFMTPMFGVLLSAIFLGEGNGFNLVSLAALLLVCAGIWLVNFMKKA